MIVRDDQLPRGLWKLGMIHEVMEGRDGHITDSFVHFACHRGSLIR